MAPLDGVETSGVIPHRFALPYPALWRLDPHSDGSLTAFQAADGLVTCVPTPSSRVCEIAFRLQCLATRTLAIDTGPRCEICPPVTTLVLMEQAIKRDGLGTAPGVIAA